MGSVQSEVECKRCKFKWAMEDYYYKTGEVWQFCDRCGYIFSAFMKHDANYGKQIKEQVEELIKQGNLNKALEISGNTGWVSHQNVNGEEKQIPILEWTDEEKIRTLRQTPYSRYHKKDKDGHYVWDIESSGGYGAYHHRSKRGGGTGGHFLSKWSARKTIKNMIRAIKSPKRAKEFITYTKKLNGKWYMFDARTGEKAEIPTDIGFLLWMRRQNGDLKPYNPCPSCKGNGGSRTGEGTEPKEWQNCETCKGEGVLI